MVNFDEVGISKLITHYIGQDDDDIVLSNSLISTDSSEALKALKKVLLNPFTSQVYTFEFKHEVDIEYNVLFNLTTKIYNNEDFVSISHKIAKHLQSASKHSNINTGDLVITKLEDVKYNNGFYEGLGIYKFEEKDTFIEIFRSEDKIDFRFKKGLGSKKPEKACLVLFTDLHYTLLVIDNNKGETDYWQNDFIKHKPKADNVNDTSNFLELTKAFITKQIPENFQVSKTEQIEYLSRSIDYFKAHDTFEKEEFENEVFHHKVIIDSFREYDKKYQAEREVAYNDSFEIANVVVKKQARHFKNILKLDKNFHIYIHGDTQMIEKGVEKDGRKYYKIYFEQES